MPDNNFPEDELLDEGPSKSEIKRQMTALQKLGEALTELGEKDLSRIPIEDPRLEEAIRETRRIKSNNARKRHMQFIGRLMRDIDPQPIEQAMAAMRGRREEHTRLFHQLEELRDKVLEQGLQGANLVVEQWPTADRQQIRQLILQHQRELKAGKPAAASRKLFKYLRGLQELGSDSS